MRVRISRRATTDLDEIWLHIAEQDGIEPAQRLIGMLSEKFFLILSQPFIGRSEEELRPALRSFPAGNYRIYYEPRHDYIRIVRVLHGARDREKALRRAPKRVE